MEWPGNAFIYQNFVEVQVICIIAAFFWEGESIKWNVPRSSNIYIYLFFLIYFRDIYACGCFPQVALAAHNMNSHDLWTCSIFIAFQERYVYHFGRVIKKCLFYNYSMACLVREWKCNSLPIYSCFTSCNFMIILSGLLNVINAVQT